MKNKRKTREELEQIADRAELPQARPHAHPKFRSLKAARIFAVLLMAQGVCCIFLTEQVYKIFPFLVGGFFLLAGAAGVFLSVRIKEYGRRDTKLISQGIVFLLLGAVILYHHENADALIGGIWGVIGLVKGGEILNLAIYQISAKEHFLRELIHGVIELLLAVLLLLDPLTAVAHHVVILGLEFLTIGLQTAAEAARAGKMTEEV